MPRQQPASWRTGPTSLFERRTTLVTVNPDLFVERVAHAYDLANHFDAVVVSCSEATDDKTTLCEVALDRLGFRGQRSDALLIDNRRDLAEGWQRSGGSAYLYRGDEAFQADLPTIFG